MRDLNDYEKEKILKEIWHATRLRSSENWDGIDFDGYEDNALLELFLALDMKSDLHEHNTEELRTQLGIKDAERKVIDDRLRELKMKIAKRVRGWS